jgi:hydrogenase-4 component H
VHRLHNLRYSLLSQGNLVHKGARHWDHLEFFAGQCSFCGLCVQYCPTHAITNHGELPPVTGDQSQLKVAHEILYHPCASCGKPIIPIPEEALEQVYGGALTDLEVGQRTMCQECRRKAASRRLHDIFARS